MPISEAALAGIRANGHRWKYQIRLADLTNQIGTFDDDTPEDVIENVRDQIVKKVEAWLSGPRIEPDMVTPVQDVIDDLRDIEPDVDELRYVLNRLFDEFYYYRVVSV